MITKIYSHFQAFIFRIFCLKVPITKPGEASKIAELSKTQLIQARNEF